MAKCEWDPIRNSPAIEWRMNDGLGRGRQGCDNEVEVIVGADGKWHLCRKCAVLEKFSRFRKRKFLKKTENKMKWSDLK